MNDERYQAIKRYISGPLGLSTDDRQMVNECLDEITSLRTEAEQLKSQKDYYAEMAGHSGRLIQERDEALAHVAVLSDVLDKVRLRANAGNPAPDNDADKIYEEYEKQITDIWHLVRAIDVPAEAHALLDRLQGAEAVVEAVRKHREFLEQEYGWICRGPLPWSAGLSEQDAIEFEALAAWEEGKT